MGSHGAEIDDQSSADSTPEDVAVLYAWANLRGAKYRDYSASRREHRAQVRYRAAKGLLERELKAQAEAEAAAEQAEREAFAAEAIALSQTEHDSQASRLESLRIAEAAARKATAERVEAARRSEAAAHAAMLALREEREISEAHASAQEQAMIYTESDLRRRQLAGPQPRLRVGGATGSEFTLGIDEVEKPKSFSESEDRGRQGDLLESRLVGFGVAARKPLFDADVSSVPMGWALDQRPAGELKTGGDLPNAISEVEQVGPAWLFGGRATSPRTPAAPVFAPGISAEATAGRTLQDSREQVAARWFALKGVFENAAPELAAVQSARPGDVGTPLVAVYSLAGGVGKTSLVAALGRALSLKGEKVVVTDTTSDGLLPYYFGARQLTPGVVRAFAPPEQKPGEPTSLVIYDAARRGGDERQQATMAEEILRNVTGNHRVLLDLPSGSSWLIRQMANRHPIVLVPIMPDMNSVISLQAVEKLFRSITDSEGRSILPFYVLNRFVASLPLHLDVREVFRRQLGERLLRVAIRDSQAVSEALAEGMTAVDYAPSSPVSLDLLEVAAWVRSMSPPATAESRPQHWSER
jgi:cellulose synthase operon protein YhjQ